MFKKLILIAVICLIPITIQAKSFYPEATPTLKKDQFWTKTYFKKDSQTAVLTFRVWFKQPAHKVWQTLTDTASFKAKMNNYNEAKTLSKTLFKKITDNKPTNFETVEKMIGENKLTSDHNRRLHKNWTDYVYFRFNFPWPLTDRWALQKIKCDETNYHKDEYKFEYKMIAGNFEELFGYWHLAPIPGKPGWTEFRGRYESNAGISVPKFVTKKAMTAGLKKDVEEYRKIMRNE